MTFEGRAQVTRVLITGITGQDGAYLARLLGDEGLDVNRLHLRSRPAVTRLGEILAA